MFRDSHSMACRILNDLRSILLRIEYLFDNYRNVLVGNYPKRRFLDTLEYGTPVRDVQQLPTDEYMMVK